MFYNSVCIILSNILSTKCVTIRFSPNISIRNSKKLYHNAVSVFDKGKNFIVSYIMLYVFIIIPTFTIFCLRVSVRYFGQTKFTWYWFNFRFDKNMTSPNLIFRKFLSFHLLISIKRKIFLWLSWNECVANSYFANHVYWLFIS